MKISCSLKPDSTTMSALHGLPSSSWKYLVLHRICLLPWASWSDLNGKRATDGETNFFPRGKIFETIVTSILVYWLYEKFKTLSHTWNSPLGRWNLTLFSFLWPKSMDGNHFFLLSLSFEKLKNFLENVAISLIRTLAFLKTTQWVNTGFVDPEWPTQ